MTLFAGAQTQTPSASPVSSPATQTLSVNANLVVVPVTVRDNKDRLIRSLTKDAFTLTVDGKPQPIRYFDREDDIPLTVGLLVDVSISQRTVLDAERTASSAFLDGMLQPERDRAFVVQFGHSADLLADVTPSVPKLQAAVQKIDADTDRPNFHDSGDQRDHAQSSSGSGNGNDSDNSGNHGDYGDGGYGGRRGGRGGGGRGGYAGGGTVLYDAVFLASDEVLRKAPAAKSGSSTGQARKALVVLTDGSDRGSKESLTAAIEAAQRNDVAIYAIYYKGEEQQGGFGRGSGGHGGYGGGRGGYPGGGGGYPGGGGGRERVDGKKILERMADETGGRVYDVTKKTPLSDIYKQIAEELRSQYRLGFSPATSEEGYHKVVVDVPKEKKLSLQARDGYYTGTAK